MIRDRKGVNYVREMKQQKYNNTLQEIEMLQKILKEKMNGTSGCR